MVDNFIFSFQPQDSILKTMKKQFYIKYAKQDAFYPERIFVSYFMGFILLSKTDCYLPGMTDRLAPQWTQDAQKLMPLTESSAKKIVNEMPCKKGLVIEKMLDMQNDFLDINAILDF